MLDGLKPYFIKMAEPHNPSDLNKSLWKRLWLLFLLAVVGALLLFLGLTGSRILRAAAETPTGRADVIAIFGAAEYSGRPSPVFRARLDHGYELFQQGLAPVVITTGGAAQDPEFSEGGVGRDYLLKRGIPEQALIAETARLRYGAIGGARGQYHAREWHAQLHSGQRCLSCVSHSRFA